MPVIDMEKVRAVQAAQQKVQDFPRMLYDDIRVDVRKYLEEKAPDLALSTSRISVARLPDGSGYGGVFATEDDSLYLYAMSGAGFVYRPVNDVEKARVMLQSMLDSEQRKSILVRRREAAKDLDVLVFDLGKALPTSGKEQPTKQAKKPIAAGNKQAGAGPKGKVRYNYPTEKGKPGAAPKVNEKPPEPENVEGPGPAPAQEPEQKPFVDPSKLAALLQTSIGVLRRVAMKFQASRKMEGRKGFVHFMSSQLSALNKKHDLDAKYYGLCYDALVGNPQAAYSKKSLAKGMLDINELMKRKKEASADDHKKPYGHTGYYRKTKTGKTVYVQPKGVKPTQSSMSEEERREIQQKLDGARIEVKKLLQELDHYVDEHTVLRDEDLNKFAERYENLTNYINQCEKILGLPKTKFEDIEVVGDDEWRVWKACVNSWIVSSWRPGAMLWKRVACSYYGRDFNEEKAIRKKIDPYSTDKEYEGLVDGHHEFFDDGILALKERTRAYYERKGVKSLPVYRGVRGEYAKEIVKQIRANPTAEYIDIPMSVLASWTPNLQSARDFTSGYGDSGVILKYNASIDDMWWSYELSAPSTNHLKKKRLLEENKNEVEIVVGSKNGYVRLRVKDLTLGSGEPVVKSEKGRVIRLEENLDISHGDWLRSTKKPSKK